MEAAIIHSRLNRSRKEASRASAGVTSFSATVRVEPKLGRAVDDSHSPAGGYFLDSVAGELRADRKLCCCLLRHSDPRSLKQLAGGAQSGHQGWRGLPAAPFGPERLQRTFLVAEDPQPKGALPRMVQTWAIRPTTSAPLPLPRTRWCSETTI